jgi:uncharacterized protein (DUF885 family)
MRFTVLAACLALACGPKGKTVTPAPTPSPLAADAVAGITNPALSSVVAEHWEHMMRWAPTWATTLGDHRYDDKLAPRDGTAIAAIIAERQAMLKRLGALDAAKLDDTDRVTHALLAQRLESEIALDVCKTYEWTVDSGGSSLFGELSYIVESHTVKLPKDAENLITRMNQARRLNDDTIANLERVLKSKRVTSAE